MYVPFIATPALSHWWMEKNNYDTLNRLTIIELANSVLIMLKQSFYFIALYVHPFFYLFLGYHESSVRAYYVPLKRY